MTSAMLAVKEALCQGKKVRVPPMSPLQLGILLNEVAADREEIHGPQLPTKH